MTFKNGFATALALGAGMMLITAAAEAKCYQAGGSATMITKDLAEYMANAALKNSISGHGWTASGSVRMKCTDDGLTTSCTARQTACGK